MSDPTETFRRNKMATINAKRDSRRELERWYGQVWDSAQVTKDFHIHAFLAPYISVTRKEDGATGVLTFQHDPRFYFHFAEDI